MARAPAGVLIGLIVVTACLGFREPAAAAPRDEFIAALAALESVPNERLLETLAEFIDARITAIEMGRDTQAEVAAQRRGLLIGLALLFDTHGTLASQRFTRSSFEALVTTEEAARRRHLTDRFAVHGRCDAMQHFFISCGLTVVVGPVIAERLGRIKEMADARAMDENPQAISQGYSFVDLAYDIAGIHFALSVTNPVASRTPNSPRPTIVSFLAPIPALALPEGLGWEQFQATYGGDRRQEFATLIGRIRDATRGEPKRDYKRD